MKKILLASSFFPLTILAFALSFMLLLNPNMVVKVQGASDQAQGQENQLEEAIRDISASSYEDDLNSQKDAVRLFLVKHNSPLSEHADYIVDVSNTYGIDYRIIPAIAMQESNLCKKAPLDSYNCWGYGIYGGKVTSFSNYKEGVERVAFTLSQSYIKKGYSSIEQIMSKYTPRNTNDWVFAVTHFMSQID